MSFTLKLQMAVSVDFAERLTGLIEGKMLIILVINAMFYDVKSCLRVSGCNLTDFSFENKFGVLQGDIILSTMFFLYKYSLKTWKQTCTRGQ